MLRIAKALKDLLAFTSLWTLTVAGGVFLVLILLTLIGYLPYSDRPGPGWQGAHLPSLQEVGFFLGWAFPFVAPFAAYCGAFFSSLCVRLAGSALRFWYCASWAAWFADFLDCSLSRQAD